MKLRRRRPDGTIAPNGLTDAREYDVTDTREYRLRQPVTIEGDSSFVVTLINHKDGFIGIARPIRPGDLPTIRENPSREELLYDVAVYGMALSKPTR